MAGWSTAARLGWWKKLLIVAAVLLGFAAYVATHQHGSCSGPCGRQANRLIAPPSMGGVTLNESRADVEHALGSGSEHPTHDSLVPIRYWNGLTVYYSRADLDPHGPRVFQISTTTPAFHTASGLSVGTAYSTLTSDPSLDCAPTNATHASCESLAHGPGLVLDIAGGKVERIWVLTRTN